MNERQGKASFFEVGDKKTKAKRKREWKPERSAKEAREESPREARKKTRGKD